MNIHDTIQQPGTVLLVGAGSEAGLLTIRALQAVRGADAIVYDDLLDPSILGEAGESCELVSVGKRWNSHKKEQEEIHEILIGLAGSGKKVVRLKGGDPTVFGRGGEEYLALQEAGIRCEMIPGISSCIAAPEHMGIPVTHRGLASSFTVVTGHGARETAEEYQTLAALKGTLVFLMGLRKAGEIAEGLLGAGKDPQTPVAVLSRVFTEQERRLDGELRELAEIAQNAEAPAILVIGPTAGLHLRASADAAQKAPAESGIPGTAISPVPEAAVAEHPRPSVLIVGTQSFTRRLASLMREHGLSALRFPCIELAPQPQEIPAAEEFADYSWLVFTSANGVRIFLEELRNRNGDIRSLSHIRIACIGPGTAAALKEAFLHADLVPETYTAEALADELAKAVKPGEKVLILRAQDSNPILTKTLESEKILYKDCKIYSARYMEQAMPGEGRPFDYIVFASAGGVRAFFSANRIPEGAIPVCIGEITAMELKRLTGDSGLVAAECSARGIVNAIINHSEGR